MSNSSAIAPLLCLVLTSCWIGKYEDYSISAQRTDEVTASGGTEQWFVVQAVHQVTFNELEDAPAQAELRDSGYGSMTLDVTRVSGEGTLQAEMLYWACSLNVFEIYPPRQGGIATLDDDGVVTMEHELDFIGGQKLGFGSGAPVNCAPGGEPVRALGLRLVATGDAVWELSVDSEVSYARSYPKKYYDVEGGSLDLTWLVSSREEVGWVPQLSAPATTPTDTGPTAQPWSGLVIDSELDGIDGVDFCAELEGQCTETDDVGWFELPLEDYPAGSLRLRDFVLERRGYAPTVSTWFALLGPVGGIDMMMLDEDQRAAVHDAAGTTPDDSRGDVLVRVQSTGLEPLAGVPLVRHGGAGPLVAFDDDDEPTASLVSGSSGIMVIPNVPPGRFGVAGLSPWTCNPAGGRPGETNRADVYVRAGMVSEVVVSCY